MSTFAGGYSSAVGRLVFLLARWFCIIAAIISEDTGNSRKATARQRHYLRISGPRNTILLGTIHFPGGCTAGASCMCFFAGHGSITVSEGLLRFNPYTSAHRVFLVRSRYCER